MLNTTHALAGAFIGQKIGNPLWAFFISLASHYLLDFIPHGDEFIGQWVAKKNSRKRTLLVVITDLITLTIFLLFILSRGQSLQLSSMLSGLIGAILPDLFVYVIGPPGNFLLKSVHSFQKTNWLKTFFIKHNQMHNRLHNPLKKDMSPKVGIVFQFLLSIFFFLQIIN